MAIYRGLGLSPQKVFSCKLSSVILYVTRISYFVNSVKTCMEPGFQLYSKFSQDMLFNLCLQN